MRLASILFSVTVLTATFSGCSFRNGDGAEVVGCDAAAYEQQQEQLRERIEEEVGRAEAAAASACRAIGLGEKPCGGPWEYLVYSTTASDSAEVERLVAEYNRVNEAYNSACELMSDCMMVMPPELAVVDGRCVAAQP